ncbi:transketolase [Gammaproteobacteria bacterium]|nr:transketolase [Gammaproteobacteria bacterium]
MTSESLSTQIRIDALQMVHDAKASHIGSALSIADILAVLYEDILNIDPKDPNNINRDRFILSKGHACVAVYAALANKDFFDRSLLASYGKDYSPLMNHISHKIDGVEFSTGALGHGLSFGVGKALSLKMSRNPSRVYVLLSDGEMQEGSNWEALMFAAHHGLGSLTAIIDYNNLQSLDSVDNTLSLHPLTDKLASFGCNVSTIDGHDHNQIRSSLLDIDLNKPNVLICKTIKGKGVSFMENKVDWHYSSPNQEQLTQSLRELRYEK